MLVKLKEAIGSIVPFDEAVSTLPVDSDSRIERDCLLVYAGKFQSLDGEVEVTSDQLARLAKNHNGLISRTKRLVGGDVPLKHYPPIQLDHSTSAWDTVGRLTGELRLDNYAVDGKVVPALFGRLCILGRENVERVVDGRWTHLSIGADFDKGALSELTITPFPAAASASMLAAGSTDTDDETVKSTTEPAEERSMDKEKLKKYLTGVKKMSESEADQEMARLSLEEKKEELSKLSAECDEHEKRLAAESDEKEKKEKEEAEGKDKEAKLSAARGKITQLKSGFTTLAEGARLAARSGKILTRLSALRAEAKITPAEIKKLDLKKLATESDASLELMLKSYKDREPVIHVGQLGSIRATNLASVQTSSRLSKLEAETRANMSLLSNSKDAAPDVRLSSAPHMSAAAELAPTPEEAAAVETEYNELVRLMDGGMVPAAKDRLKAFLVKATRLGGYAGGDYVESNSAETEREIAALSETVTKMQAQFEELASVASAALS